MPPSRQQLLHAAENFCNAFARKEDTSTLLSFFSTTYQPSVFEHGDPSLAPFLGRPFRDIDHVRDYFEAISSLLSYDDMVFIQFVVDTEFSRVAAVGKARFKWLRTEETWNETFSYILDFDDSFKVIGYQIWADSGAAYLASIGKLADVQAAAASPTLTA